MTYQQDVRNDYAHEFGEADDVIEFRHDSVDVKVPIAVDILLFLPIDAPGEDQITMIATAGMSSHQMNGPTKRVELAYEFNGDCQKNDKYQFAKCLAELSVVPFRDAHHYHAGMILQGIELPPFGNMTCAVLVDWDGLAVVTLGSLDTNPTLLRLIPLYPAEADFVQSEGVIRGLTILRARGLVYEDQRRDSII